MLLSLVFDEIYIPLDSISQNFSEIRTEIDSFLEEKRLSIEDETSKNKKASQSSYSEKRKAFHWNTKLTLILLRPATLIKSINN